MTKLPHVQAVGSRREFLNRAGAWTVKKGGKRVQDANATMNVWDPLVFDEQAFRLLLKHLTLLSRTGRILLLLQDEDPRRAICLAIIAKHE